MVMPKKELSEVQSILTRQEAHAYGVQISGSENRSQKVGAFCNRENINHQQRDLTQPKKEVRANLQRKIVRMFSGEDASGTSAVAIDNKIEQAMDLVKSHLMIAVREEVEVLKEKIAELMDRINQLELENTILKANVSQETLSQLSATMQQTTTKPSQNTNASNGPVS